MKPKLALAAMLLAGSAAQAADPVASGLPGGFTFAEYSGTAAVGAGLVDTNNVLFFIDEQTVAVQAVWRSTGQQCGEVVVEDVCGGVVGGPGAAGPFVSRAQVTGGVVVRALLDARLLHLSLPRAGGAVR